MKIRIAFALGCAALPLKAGAEERAAGPRGEKTAVYMQAGYSSGDVGGATFGGMVVRELGSRLAVEASAAYLGRGMGSNGLSASAALLFNLRPSGEKAVPYLAAGGGLYRASFDMGNGRYSGPMNMGGSMMDGYGMMGPGPAPGAAWNYGQMPHFYGRRLANGAGTQMPYSGHRSFTDPAISLGGGIRIDLGSPRGLTRGLSSSPRAGTPAPWVSSPSTSAIGSEARAAIPPRRRPGRVTRPSGRAGSSSRPECHRRSCSPVDRRERAHGFVNAP